MENFRREQRLLDLFPCEGGDLRSPASYVTRNEKAVTLTHLRNIVEIENKVSTKLTLSIEGGDLARVASYVTRNAKAVTLMHLRNIAEIDDKVSTKLTLSIQPDIWDIKKTLLKSDNISQARLIIPKESAIKYILKYFTEEQIRMVEGGDKQGLRINVFDSNTKTGHELCFKRWNSSGSYVLNNNWNRDFVHRRNLQVGDQIGLFWNPYASRLHFRVLARSNPTIA